MSNHSTHSHNTSRHNNNLNLNRENLKKGRKINMVKSMMINSLSYEDSINKELS
jgi:hypothetical protein